MAAPEYTLFVAPYLEGWANGEEGGTPMTAEILNENYDAFLLALNEWAAAMGVAVAAIPTKTSDLTNDSNFVADSSYVHTDNNYTTNEKNKLSGIEAGANFYALPTASTSTKGGVKIDGTTITIDGNGVISSTGGGGATALSNLTDVAISSLANAQILMYNTTTSKWENVTPSFGTDVEGNPSGTPTVVLTAIKIGNTIYSIPGGSSGGNSVSYSQTLQSGTAIGTITIDGVPTTIYAPTASTKTSDLTNDSNFVSDASYVHTDNNYTTTEKNKLTDLNQVEANPSSGTSAGNLTSIEIGGTKYDIPSGGGGGTTVVANPSGAATDELNKLQVGSTIYSIPEDGGSVIGKKDILWEYSNTKDITLAHPFTDYDFIVFEGNNYRDSNHKGGAIVSSTELNDLIGVSGKLYTFVGASSEFANYTVNSTTSITYYEGYSTILRVWGIKFGSGANWTDVTGTLAAGATSITLSDAAITENCSVELFTSKLGINPIAESHTTGSITLTFDAQSEAIGVKVRVS